uniref:Uncharacterized protein n=1 Tax=Lactuca sativa TaxID=4236 RepID=A0A9R1WWI2_LACSA|nr:hypothetical protein LSAT_V11C800453550 [Lactuca sativa]
MILRNSIIGTKLKRRVCRYLHQAIGKGLGIRCDIALAMKIKFDMYFGDIEKINVMIYFSLILDLRNKVKYLVILLEDRYGEKGWHESQIEIYHYCRVYRFIIDIREMPKPIFYGT